MSQQKSMQFRSRKKLAEGDLGEQVDDGFYMADLGRIEPEVEPVEKEAPVSVEKLGRRVLSVKARTEIAERMAAQLMDYYMSPEVLNNNNILNPIRDGIPQCLKHRFVAGDSNKIGCIYGCGHRERDMGGNLPVAKDGTLGDAWTWVRALVVHAALAGDERLGVAAKGVNLTG